MSRYIKFNVNEFPVYDVPDTLMKILVEEVGLDHEKAVEALRALIKGGWAVCPIEPTNSMILAYMKALGTPPKRRETILFNTKKCKKRWQAMVQEGLNFAFSTKEIKNKGWKDS